MLIRFCSASFGLLFLLLAGLGIAVAQEEDAEKPTADSPYENIKVLATAMQLIRQDYVDEAKVDFKDLTHNALKGMLSALDPHSQFMDQESFKGMQEDTKSEFGGLGIVVSIKNGTLTIVSPMEDTPSFEAGLLPNDQILKINGFATDKLTLAEAIDLLRGEVGEKITLTVFRPATRETKDYDLTRRVIKVPSVKDARILPGELTSGYRIGYARVTQFNEPTADELAKAFASLEEQGMDGFVLDLRYNPGGLLNSAVDICSQFLPPRTMVVFTEGRGPSREYRTAAKYGPPKEIPMVILINYASASGSEIVAGALKDLQRALLVGETTFGKGSVQSVIALPDGSAVRLTTAKYFTPGRKPIHEFGVQPDIRATLSPEQEIKLLRSRRDRDLPNAEDVQYSAEDPQLKRGVDALIGTLIYEARHKSTANAPGEKL